jgi:hypothetical protein
MARPSVASFRKPSTSSRAQVSPGNPSKFDQDQLTASSALQFVMADLLLWGVPTKTRCSGPMSLQRHSILILINAADDSEPNIRKTTPVHVQGAQRCVHLTSFDWYFPKG